MSLRERERGREVHRHVQETNKEPTVVLCGVGRLSYVYSLCPVKTQELHTESAIVAGDSVRKNFPLTGRNLERNQTRCRLAFAATLWEGEGERREGRW